MPLFNFFNKDFASTTKKSKNGKKIKKGTLRHTLKRNLKQNLAKGTFTSVKDAVKCPPGENQNEWIAMNVIELYNTVGLVYSLVSGECTDEKCPTMSAGASVQYYWADGDKIKKPIKVSAPEYVNYLQAWINSQLDNENIFPTEGEFPKDFIEHVKTILKRMFRVYAHIFCHHLEKISSVDASEHFAICFKHFYFFIKEFDLVEDSDLLPMKTFIDSMNK